MRRLHMLVGALAPLGVVLTGRYTDRLHAHLDGMADGPRLLYRSAHIHLLFAALLDLLLGAYLRLASQRGVRLVQRAASATLLVLPVLFAVAFFREPTLPELERPWGPAGDLPGPGRRARARRGPIGGDQIGNRERLRLTCRGSRNAPSHWCAAVAPGYVRRMPAPDSHDTAPTPSTWRTGVRWFAAEFLVVVTGILVALALQAWYEGRQNAERERAYLAQLDADLRETDHLIDVADSLNRSGDLAGTRFIRAFYAAAAPPRDSLLTWFSQANSYEVVRPVIATAEALVTTGDLNLIRSDSVRAGVTTYLDHSRRLVASQQTYEYEFLRASDDMDRKIDYAEMVVLRAPAAIIDSVARANPMFRLPPGPRRRPFPVDTDALLRDRDAHFAIGQLVSAKRNMADLRQEMRDGARRLRTLLAAERKGAAGTGRR